MSADEAMALMRRYVPEHAATLRYDDRLTDSDQWTLQSLIRNQMPMHRIALGDDAGTEYYVSEKTGEPVIRTTASGRFWGYLSAVLHWLYFTPLRRHARVLEQLRRLVVAHRHGHVRRWGSSSASGDTRCRGASACAARRRTRRTRGG